MDNYKLLCDLMGRCPDLYHLVIVLYGIGTVWGILIGITSVLLYQRYRSGKQETPEVE